MTYKYQTFADLLYASYSGLQMIGICARHRVRDCNAPALRTRRQKARMLADKRMHSAKKALRGRVNPGE